MSESNELSISKAYPFESNYVKVNNHRLHYIEQGVGSTILFLHGNPEWSYAWRNIIPYLKDTARCIAVDLIGMGRSDQPDIGYTFLEHVDYITKFIETLNLRDITIVGLDWGVAIGLQYAAAHPDNIKGFAMVEPQALTPLKDWSEFSPPEAVEMFQIVCDPEKGWPFMRENSVFIEGMTQTIINRQITPEEHEFFREPFKDVEKRKPMWVFPNQIPIAGKPSEVVQAIERRNDWFTKTDIPKMLFYATPGCNVRGPQRDWCNSNLSNLTTYDIGHGFHYLMEENPHGIGQQLKIWFQQKM